MPVIHHNPDPCSQFRMLGHPCSAQHPQPQLLPSVYQAALNHAASFGHNRSVSHTPWEAVTFVAIVLVAYIAVLGYLATRALRQVPRGGSSSLPGGLLDTRIVYNTKTDTCQAPLPAEMTDTPEGSAEV